jgi:hypothetical protein
MQLGARWMVGDPPHPSVPAVLYDAIDEQVRMHPTAHSWTLTWLEGRPRCQLDHLVIITLDQNSVVQVLDPYAPVVIDSDDAWLE